MEWEDWIGKRIFVKLKSGAVYTGDVKDVSETQGVLFMMIIDKFGRKVSFAISEIRKILEEEI